MKVKTAGVAFYAQQVTVPVVMFIHAPTDLDIVIQVGLRAGLV